MTSPVTAVFEAQTAQELAERYDDLAGSYDAELSTDISPRRAADVLARHVAKEARILDAGCGTGKVGAILRARGYHNLDGLDSSARMLEEARKKASYAALHRQVLGEPLDLSTDSFDAVVSVGVFLRAHAPSRSFHELIRVTRPGGNIIFTLRPEFYAASDFKHTMSTLAADGCWCWVETSEPFKAGFKDFPDIDLQVWVYRVAST